MCGAEQHSTPRCTAQQSTTSTAAAGAAHPLILAAHPPGPHREAMCMLASWQPVMSDVCLLPVCVVEYPWWWGLVVAFWCRKDIAHIWELAGGEALTAQLTQGSHIFLTHRQVCWVDRCVGYTHAALRRWLDLPFAARRWFMLAGFGNRQARYPHSAAQRTHIFLTHKQAGSVFTTHSV